MRQNRSQRQRQLLLLAQQLAAMPEYPIDREANGRYNISVDGQRRLFDSEATARIGQLITHANWVRTQAALLESSAAGYSPEQRS